MKKSVAHYISELLFLHDCVILPEFGGFVGNRISAKLNKATGALSPPSKQILFNKNLSTNDGLLISHIANQEGISNEKAQESVQDFANPLNNKLNTTKVVRIDKIGLFTLGKENNIIFIQDSATNYSLDAFGMKATYNKTVERKTEVEQKVEATVKTIRTNSRNPRVMLRVAAIILPLIALSYLSISQQERINTIYTQMASLNPFETTATVEVVSEVIPVVKIEVVATPIVEVIEEEIVPVIIPEKTYYIIAGAFAEQKNADKMLAKLENWNYNTEIVTGGNLLRVSYDSFTNKADALVALNQIKQENSAAWLLSL